MNKITRLTSLVLLVVLCVSVLASCGGVGSAEKKLEKAGYTVVAVEDEYIEKANDARDDYKIKAAITAYDAESSEYVSVIKLASKKQAKAYAEEIGSGAEVKGKTVIYGTEAAVKVALGK